MRKLLCLMLLGYLHTVRAQTVFAPPGATWYYSAWNNQISEGRLFTFTAEEDTVLNGYTSRVLRVRVQQDDGTLAVVDSLTKFVVTVGDQVYYRVGQQFVLLFDFAAVPYDTITSAAEYFSIFDGCNHPDPGTVAPFEYRVMGDTVISINNVDLRAQETQPVYDALDPQWEIGTRIMERVGAVNKGYWWGGGPACILAGYPGRLRCYHDDEVDYVAPGLNVQCDYVNVAEATVPMPRLVQPNPASGIVSLPFVADAVHLYNMQGQCVAVHRHTGTFDVAAIERGLYMIAVVHDGRRFVDRVLIVH